MKSLTAPSRIKLQVVLTLGKSLGGQLRQKKFAKEPHPEEGDLVSFNKQSILQ